MASDFPVVLTAGSLRAGSVGGMAGAAPVDRHRGGDPTSRAATARACCTWRSPCACSTTPSARRSSAERRRWPGSRSSARRRVRPPSTWQSTGIAYAVEVDSPASADDVAALLEHVDRGGRGPACPAGRDDRGAGRCARRHEARSRYTPYDGGPDPLAPPVDIAEALDSIGEDVMAGYSPERAMREFLRRGGQRPARSGRPGPPDRGEAARADPAAQPRRHAAGGSRAARPCRPQRARAAGSRHRRWTTASGRCAS